MPPTATGGAAAPFRLVGNGRFVRSNPRTDRFHALAFHHVELWCSDAASAAGRFSFGLGAPLAARSDLSTGNSAHASLLLRSGSLAFLFTAPYARGVDPATASLPSFPAGAARRFAADHSLTVRAFTASQSTPSSSVSSMPRTPSTPVSRPVRASRSSLSASVRLVEVQLYGDIVLRYVSSPLRPRSPLLPLGCSSLK
jgi:4-hydroxyphenylpyruvate dioxygenase